MVEQIVMGLVGVVWAAAGLLMLAIPASMLAWSQRVLRDVWWRFWVAQAVLLMGLLLIVGTAHLMGFWLWVACGAISVGKGCLALGTSESCQARMWQWLGRRSLWWHRCGGAMSVVLAVLFTADLMLHG